MHDVISTIFNVLIGVWLQNL